MGPKEEITKDGIMRSPSLRICALSMGVVLAAAPVARAASALVVTPNAPVRAAPGNDAPVVQTFSAGDKVFVSDEVEGGFRRVQIPDKKIGYVGQADVQLEVPAPPAAPVQPLSVVRPPLYIKDLDHLADLVKDDPPLDRRASDLAERLRDARIAYGASVLVLAAGTLTSFIVEKNDCVGSGPTLCQQDPNLTYLLVGMGVSVVIAAIAFGTAPRRDEFIDVVNDWNQRHPDRPLAITPKFYAAPPQATATP
jgi:hypothetical protein